MEEALGALALHVRPRPQPAGLEVAVYTGELYQRADGCDSMTLNEERSELHAVPAGAAGVAAFAASVVETCPADWTEQQDDDGRPVGPRMGLRLPTLPACKGGVSGAWSRVEVSLHSPADVEPTTIGIYSEGREPEMRAALAFEVYAKGGTPLTLEVVNGSQRYARRQRALREQREALQQAAASAAPPPPPSRAFQEAFADLRARDKEAYDALASAPVSDSPEAFEERWRQLRDQAMADLIATVTAVLQRAVSYRGEFQPASARLGARWHGGG